MKRVIQWQDLVNNEYKILKCRDIITEYKVYADDIICKKKVLLQFATEYTGYFKSTKWISRENQSLNLFYIPESLEEATLWMLSYT